MRALLNLALALVLALALSAPVPAVAGSIPCPFLCDSCVGSQCFQCRNGAYLTGFPGTCASCTPVSQCTSTVICTSSTDSRCATCERGYYRVAGVPGSPDHCLACADVPGCVADGVTCTTDSNSICSACVEGSYLAADGSSCPTCPGITGCESDPITCTTATDAQCGDCSAGTYLDESGPADMCPACTTVDHCTSQLTCTSAASSACTSCAPGYHLVAGTCQEACTPTDCSDHGTPAANGTRPNSCGCVCDVGWQGAACDVRATDPCTRSDCNDHGDATGDRPICTCTCDAGFIGASCGGTCNAIDFCTSAVTCTNAGDSQCTSCAAGHHLVEGAVDSCPADAAITDVPVAGNRTRLSDLPKKRQSQISSYDRAIDLMSVDPTVSGATLAIFSPTTGATFSLDLPASQWQGPLPGRRFRYSAPGNPKVKILLVNGRLLKITLRGSGAYPLGTAQESIGVTLTIGTTRLCTLFGGTITKDNGVRFVARKAPRPAACPVDPAANEAPVAQPNAYETDKDTLSVALASGGFSVGNVRTDAGPLVDSDPDGDAFAVHAVLNPTLTIADNPIALTPVSGGVAAYSFSASGRTATFTIASDGALTLTGDPDVFTDLITAEGASFQFDYTDADTLGAESNPAHVTVTIHGSGGCLVGGRC